MSSLRRNYKGFTLVEMIMVIVITGIIGGIVAVFLKAPILQYLAVARRAEMTDIADMAVRRISRDVRTAVPNSVRVNGCAGMPCVEFLPTKGGGRYRSAGPGDALDFDGIDVSFDLIGTADVAVSDVVIIGSTQSSSIAYDKTPAGRWREVTAVTGVAPAATGVTLDAGLPAPAEVEAHRFVVVDEGPVTYACIAPGGGACSISADGDGTCRLVRYSGYVVNADQALPGTENPPILADKVSACQFEYDVPNQRFGLLVVRLTLTSGGESVSLYNETHVINPP